MIITKYTSFLNEQDDTQGQPSTTEEKPKVSEDVVVTDINELLKKLKEKNTKKTESTGNELVVGKKYTYKPEDADAYNITLSGITDKEYICIKEKDGSPAHINKSHKSQFTKIETKEEPKTELILGRVYTYSNEKDKDQSILLLKNIKDSDVNIQGHNIYTQQTLSYPKNKFTKEIGPFIPVFSKIVSGTVLDDIKNLKKIITTFTTYENGQENYEKEFSNNKGGYNKIDKIIEEKKKKLGIPTKAEIADKKEKEEETKKTTNPTQGTDETNAQQELKNRNKKIASDTTTGKKILK